MPLIGVAARLAIQDYERARDGKSDRTSVLVLERQSKKAAAAVAYLSGLLGAPLPSAPHRRRMPALAACLDARVAGECGLRFRPWRLIRALRSITRPLDTFAERRVIHLLFAYWNFRMVLRRRRPAFLLCVSDLSPRRLAAACAANATDTPVLFFQDDWHHDVVPPFATAAASVLNGRGLQAVRPSLAAGGIVAARGAAPAVAGVRRCCKPMKRIGIALNTVFNPQELLELAQTIATLVPEAEIRVRCHPRTRTRLKASGGAFVEAPAGQLLGDFAAGCDVVLVGNSAAQIGLLLAGVAVVHVGNLDKLRFDTYGYVAAGVVYGMDVVKALDVDAINAFYSDTEWRRRFLATLAFGDLENAAVHPADALGRWMAARLSAGSRDAAAAS